MPDLIACPGCEQDVSPEAVACPGCGHPIRKARQRTTHLSPLLLGLFFVVAALVSLNYTSDPRLAFDEEAKHVRAASYVVLALGVATCIASFIAPRRVAIVLLAVCAATFALCVYLLLSGHEPQSGKKYGAESTEPRMYESTEPRKYGAGAKISHSGGPPRSG